MVYAKSPFEISKAELRRERKNRERHHEKVRERYQREMELDRADDDSAALAITAVMATEAQIEAFEQRLDIYDEAVVKALEENARQLEVAESELERLVENSHELPDGRRVFEARDGEKVFDRSGREVELDAYERSKILPEYTKWEEYKSAAEKVDELHKVREDILAFQEKSDLARERLDDGGLTGDELTELQQELEADMPDAVKAEVPDMQVEPTVAMHKDFAVSAAPMAQQVAMPQPDMPTLGQ